jgi:hypothetical protein
MITTTETPYPLPEGKEQAPPFEALEPTTWQLALCFAAIAAFKLESGEGVYSVSMQKEEDPTDAIIPPRWEEFTRYTRLAGHALTGQIDRLLIAEAAIRELVLSVDKSYQRPDASKVEAYSNQCLLPCFDAVLSLACLLLERGSVSAMELWEIAMPEAFARRTAIARHEAGHAVVHHVTGNTPVYVSIVPDVDCVGCCIIAPDPKDASLSVNHHVSGMLAGPVAECMFTNSDLELDHDTGDMSRVNRLLVEHDLTNDRRQSVLMSSLMSACTLLRLHQNVVEELAHELLDRHWIVGEGQDEFLRARINPDHLKA